MSTTGKAGNEDSSSLLEEGGGEFSVSKEKVYLSTFLGRLSEGNVMPVLEAKGCVSEQTGSEIELGYWGGEVLGTEVDK